MDQEKNFWEFVDGFVESPEILQEFCRKRGYLLEGHIGSGGFGSVYRVKNTVTGEALVLKALDFSTRKKGIDPVFYARENEIYCDVKVEINASLEQILSQEKVDIPTEQLLPFLVTSEAWGAEPVFWEQVKYPRLAAAILSPPPYGPWPGQCIPDAVESWLADRIDSEKLHMLSVWELMRLAPDICTEKIHIWENEVLRMLSAGHEIFPRSLDISLADLFEQISPLYAKSLLREFLYDVKAGDPYWKYRRLSNTFPQELGDTWKKRTVCLNEIWERYSLSEIELRFPGFFQIRVSCKLPASLALPYLSGENRQELKRLLAIKNEIITANAARRPFKGLNCVLEPPFRIGGNVFIISPFLADPADILPSRYCETVDEEHEGEMQKRTIFAFPQMIKLLWSMGELFQSGPWELGDIKESNFKVDAAGEWRLVDFGGHLLRYLNQRGWQYLVGSNDYASQSLFMALNTPLNEEVEPEILALAHGDGSRWFSAIKTVVRMLSGREADRLRGEELNNALVRDFWEYYRRVFSLLVDLLLLNKTSSCHYQRFSISDEDVASLFSKGKNPGTETALRRFLFIIGLSLTGEPPWSVLDETMQQRISLCCRPRIVGHSSWQVSVKGKEIVLAECPREVEGVMRGLHPGAASKLLKVFFPGLENTAWIVEKLGQKRREILDLMAELGVFFTPCEQEKFYNDLRKRLGLLARAPWFSRECLEKIWEIRKKLHDILAPQKELEQDDSLADAEKLKEQLTALSKKSEIPLDSTRQLLEQALAWQRHCFRRYLFAKPSRETLPGIDVLRAQAFFQDRWLLLRHAFVEKNEPLLQYACRAGWIASLEKVELQKLRFMADACSDVKHATVLLVREWMKAREHPEAGDVKVVADAYRNLWEKQRSALRRHPFFPPLENKDWTGRQLAKALVGDAPLRDIFSPEQFKRWQKALYWSELSNVFPGAGVIASKEFLEIFTASLKDMWREIYSRFERCGALPGKEIPGDWQQLQCQNNHYLEELSDWSVLEEDVAFCISLKLYRAATVLETQIRELERKVLGHFLCATKPRERAVTEHLRIRIEEIYAAGRDFALEKALEHLGAIERELQQGGLANRRRAFIRLDRWLEKIDGILRSREPVYLKSPCQNQRPVVGTGPILKQFSPESLGAWDGDRLKNRIARFLGKLQFDDRGFVLDKNQRNNIDKLLENFYRENTLQLPTEQLDEEIQPIYDLLWRATNGFQKIPEELEDVVRIASTRLSGVDPKKVSEEFNALIPPEVQAPKFPRSVLLEFLEHQIDISMHEGQEDKARLMRKKILLMHLQRELEELSQKYEILQKKYPKFLHTAKNLALLEKSNSSLTLQREATLEWPHKVKIFEDYLNTTRAIIKQEESGEQWRWKQFLKDCDNSFLQRIYPDLKDQDLRDIYLLLFDLSPLPSLKETRDFMKKCRNFALENEQRYEIAAMLKDEGLAPDERCRRAGEFVERNAWSGSEEELRLALCELGNEAQPSDNFWKDYLQERKKLEVTQRISANSALMKFLQLEENPDRIKSRLNLELWLARFQSHVDPKIVRYFAAQLESFPADRLMRICEVLEMRNPEGDCKYLFGWLFQDHLLFPKLHALARELPHYLQKMGEDIISLLSSKGEVPLELEYTLLKEIADRSAAGWEAQKILTRLHEKVTRQEK